MKKNRHPGNHQPPTTTPTVTKRSEKAGLPPGTLIHIGEKSDREIKVTVIDYNADGAEQKEISAINECFYFMDASAISWINVEGLHEVELVQQLGDCQGIHPLVLEDILNTEQRPKAEDFGNYLFIVLKMLRATDDSEISTEQVSLIIGENFVISFQEGLEGDAFNPIRERIKGGKGRIRSMGADYLAYSLIDAVVDDYFVALEKIGEEMEELEAEVVTSPTRETQQKIHRLKRTMIFLRKAVWPLREVISGLERRDSHLISQETIVYFRDVYDHTVQVIDTIETYRDILSGMLDIHLSSLSNRTNEVMKVLTIIATIFMPLTFIVGLYGMNFKYMPELEWHWGYPAVLLLMAVLSAWMVLFFRRKKWL
ncbi:MAG: magnesium and cobalt transport protein CorA [Desulfuromonadales bacterium]|nr:MAG: magnesium and cobalt transport protein CorA [Desulfuromonadales bacterium]